MVVFLLATPTASVTVSATTLQPIRFALRCVAKHRRTAVASLQHPIKEKISQEHACSFKPSLHLHTSLPVILLPARSGSAVRA